MAADILDITVVCCIGPRATELYALCLPARSTVKQALLAWRQNATHDAVAHLADAVDVGIWGRKARLEQELREGDRLEIYRALTVDPKVARRERFKGQGTRTAGLFARRRA